MQKGLFMHKFIIGSTLLAGVIFSTAISAAEKVAPANATARPMPPRGEMRRGMMPPRNEMMMTARLVINELKAYQANPTAENFAVLEKALDKAIKEDTAKRKERLEKELANLEKDQAKRANDLLTKIKSGDFKMPERPFPFRGGKGAAAPGTPKSEK